MGRGPSQVATTTTTDGLIRLLPAAWTYMVPEWPSPTTISSSSIHGIDDTSITNQMMKLMPNDKYKNINSTGTWIPDSNLLTGTEKMVSKFSAILDN
jgi:hypothetical protein